MNSFQDLRYIDTTPKSEKVKRLCWCAVWRLFFRPTPRGFIFNAWRVRLLRLFGAKIGKGSRVAPTCFVWAPWNLEMGQFSAMGDAVDCYTVSKITIGSKVAISQRAFLCTGTHDISDLRRPLVSKPIVIHDHAWVCAEVFIGPGLTVGEGAVIGARSAVFKNVEPWTVNGGNPAKFIRRRTIAGAEPDLRGDGVPTPQV